MGNGFNRGKVWRPYIALGLTATLSGCSIHVHMPVTSGQPETVTQTVSMHWTAPPNQYDPPPTETLVRYQVPECPEWDAIKSLPAFDIEPYEQDTSPEGLLRAALSRISTVDALIEKGRINVQCHTNTTNARP